MKIKTIAIDTPLAPFAGVFQSFQENGLTVPVPLQLMTASPPLFEGYLKILNHYYTHNGLSRRLMTAIRYAVAFRLGFAACIDFNRAALNKMGIVDGLAQLENGTPLSTMNRSEAFLFSFALDALFCSEKIDRARIETARTFNIDDALLFDASFHGALLFAMGPLVNSFQ